MLTKCKLNNKVFPFLFAMPLKSPIWPPVVTPICMAAVSGNNKSILWRPHNSLVVFMFEVVEFVELQLWVTVVSYSCELQLQLQVTVVSYSYKLQLWVTVVCYSYKLPLWVTVVSYSCELQLWVTVASYSCELQLWVTVVSYSCELQFRVSGASCSCDIQGKTEENDRCLESILRRSIGYALY